MYRIDPGSPGPLPSSSDVRALLSVPLHQEHTLHSSPSSSISSFLKPLKTDQHDVGPAVSRACVPAAGSLRVPQAPHFLSPCSLNKLKNKNKKLVISVFTTACQSFPDELIS